MKQIFPKLETRLKLLWKVSSTCNVQSTKARKSISSDLLLWLADHYDDVTFLLSQGLPVHETHLLSSWDRRSGSHTTSLLTDGPWRLCSALLEPLMSQWLGVLIRHWLAVSDGSDFIFWKANVFYIITSGFKWEEGFKLWPYAKIQHGSLSVLDSIMFCVMWKPTGCFLY